MNKFNSLHDSRLKRILKRIINVKFFITIAITMSFAFSLRYFYSHVLELGISLEKLDVANLSLCSIIILFRGLFTIVLDEFFPSYLYSDNQDVKTKQTTTLSMDDGSSKRVPPSVGGSSKSAPFSLGDMLAIDTQIFAALNEAGY